jgi:uncharacterized protein involved in exopolysaccharide biosynthesis
MADSEFNPLETISSLLSRWWISVVMAVSGGILGWAFHFFNPAVYEATAGLTITMDFSQRALTQYEQDYAFSTAGAIIVSNAVMGQILELAQISGISISSTQLAQQMFSEGRQSVWELHIRDQDPQVAAALANIWAQAAYDTLNSALEHAIMAEQIQVQIGTPEACLSLCPGMTESVLQSWTDELVQEKKLSQGILPTMEFALTGNATIPEKPVLYNQASLTLAGALIGFVISLWVVDRQRVQPRG